MAELYVLASATGALRGFQATADERHPAARKLGDPRCSATSGSKPSKATLVRSARAV